VREDNSLRVFENGVLRKIFGPEGRGIGGLDEVAELGAS
jgi:hypothetical protein